MRWHCNECGCEFDWIIGWVGEKIICPQCAGTDVREIDPQGDATN